MLYPRAADAPRGTGILPVLRVTVVALLTVLLAPLPSQAQQKELTLYTSVDEPYFSPLIKKFEQQTQIKVRVVTDGEATKTAALVEKLEAEKDNPRADVYWGNEVFHTVTLSEKGLFAPYRPDAAKDIPARWRDPKDLYTPLGLRARVLGISTRPKFKQIASQIKTLEDLGNPALKDRLGVCNPAFGTASGHFAALYVLWGEEKYTAWLKALKANNIKLLGGNSVVAAQVSAGNLITGPTDNDDITAAREEGSPIEQVIPDQGDAQFGTLLIPTTVSLLNKAPHAEEAQKLIDFLTDPAVEKGLVEAHYLAYSTRDTTRVKAMALDYHEAARQMRHAVELALTILQDRK